MRRSGRKRRKIPVRMKATVEIAAGMAAGGGSTSGVAMAIFSAAQYGAAPDMQSVTGRAKKHRAVSTTARQAATRARNVYAITSFDIIPRGRTEKRQRASSVV